MKKLIYTLIKQNGLCFVFLLIFLAGCQQELNKDHKQLQIKQTTNSSKSASEAIDVTQPFMHVVYFWLKDPENAQDRAVFETALFELLDKSAYINTSFVGTPPNATRTVVDDSFSYTIILTFDSAADQEKYQKEAAHLAFIEKAEYVWEKVIVYDALKKS